MKAKLGEDTTKENWLRAMKMVSSCILEKESAAEFSLPGLCSITNWYPTSFLKKYCCSGFERLV